MAYSPIFQNTITEGIPTEPYIERILGNSYQVVRYVAQQLHNLEVLSGTMPSLPDQNFPVLPQALSCGVPSTYTGTVGPMGPMGPQGPVGPAGTSSHSLNYSGQLTTRTLFYAAAGLPEKAVVTSVLIASGGKAFVHVPVTEQTLTAKNIHIKVTGGTETTVVGTGLPSAVEAGEWVPSPNKEPLAAGKYMAAYWGDYASYKGYGRLGTLDFMTGAWSVNADQSVASGVPEYYFNLDYITEPNKMGGNVAVGGTRVALAKQLSHIYYAFFFPNCGYADWLRLIPKMELPPASVFGTIEDAVADGGVDKGNWVLETSYVKNDIVLRDGVYYAALCENTGQDPSWVTAGIRSEWISGSYLAPTSDGGVAIPTYVNGVGITKPLPARPGKGYAQTAYLGNISPLRTSVQAMIAGGGIGPGTVWRTDANTYWCGLTWAGYYDEYVTANWAAHDGSHHTMGGSTQAELDAAHRRIYWRAIIPKGALVPTDPDTWQDFLEKLPNLRAVNPNLKLCLSVGGWSRSHYFGIVGSSPTLTAAFVASCMTYCRKFLADGIDMDWETPGGQADTNYICNGVWPDDPAYGAMLAASVLDPTINKYDKTAYTTLMRELRAAFTLYNTPVINGGEGGRYLELSSAIVPGAYAIYNVMDSFQYQDQIQLMSYIFYGSWQSEILPFAGLYKAAGHDSAQSILTVDGFAQIVCNSHDGVGGVGKLGTGKSWSEGPIDCILPKNKLVLGTTSNGVAYRASAGSFMATPITGGYQITGTASGGFTAWRPATYGGATGFIDEDALYHRYLSGELVRHWDPVSKTAMYVGTATSDFEVISADDVTGFWHKANYCVNNGYKGMMIWELSGDTKDVPDGAAWTNGAHLGGQVVDGAGKQFNGIDTMVYVLNRPATGTEVTTPGEGEVSVVFSRSANTGAGTTALATCAVADATDVDVKILYELL